MRGTMLLLSLLMRGAAARSFSEGVLTVRLKENIVILMEQPFEPLEYTTESYDMSFLDLSDTVEVREWCYAETLATATGDQTRSMIDMLYVGLEDGRFIGYFSPESYTFKGIGAGTADDAELGWSPHSLDTVNDMCENVTCVANSTVSASCASSTYSGSCKQRANGAEVDEADAGYADQTACESAGNIWWAPCTTDNCCDSSIRNYYSTSRAARGAPVDFTRWRLYDHRVRPWYRQAIASWENSGVASGWSSVYTFSTSGQLGVTAMQTVAQADGTPEAVFAVDFALPDIARVVNNSLTGTEGSFAYVVEKDTGLFIGMATGSTTQEPLLDETGARRSALDSTNSYIAASAAFLAAEAWPDNRAYRHGGGSVGWEIHTTDITVITKGLAWVVVAGQAIQCEDTQVWSSLDGRCTTCLAGKQPEPQVERVARWESTDQAMSWENWLQERENQHECVQCPAGKATLPGRDGICVQCEDGKEPTEKAGSVKMKSMV